MSSTVPIQFLYLQNSSSDFEIASGEASFVLTFCFQINLEVAMRSEILSRTWMNCCLVFEFPVFTAAAAVEAEVARATSNC